MNPLRFVKSAFRLAMNARPRPPQGPPRIAGLLPTRNYNDACSVVEALGELSDLTIVLDDNSDQPFPHAGRCAEVVTLRNKGPWNASSNLTLLMYRAFVHGCEWVVTLDDDILLSASFQKRADVLSVIERMRRERADICHFPLRDLWENETQTREDGVWSVKTFPVVRRNWFFYDGLAFRDPSARLHSGAFPSSLRPRWFVDEAHRAYHTGSMTRRDREERVAKYRREDPKNEFQKDYAYMLDDSSLEVRAVPAADGAAIAKRYRRTSGR